MPCVERYAPVGIAPASPVLKAMPPLGTFNLHASLLPRYRGAAPINRAVMNGDTETGVTTFFLKHEIDTGDVIAREKIEIAPDEDAGSVHDRLMALGAKVCFDFTRSELVARITDAFAFEYLDSCHISAYVKFRPCSGVWSQSAYVVVHIICAGGPTDSAIFFEYFWCGGCFFAVGQILHVG